MASSLSKPEQSTSSNVFPEEQEEREQELKGVTSQVLIKPAQSARSMDKDAVLRRIRQQKRMNRVREAIQSFFPATFLASSESNVGKASGSKVRWVDDAFAAP